MAPSRLTRSTRRHSSSVISRKLDAAPADAGVDEARVDPAELADRLGHRRHDGLLVADVADHGVDVAAELRQLLDGGVVLRRVGAPDGDGRAALGEPLGVAEADAAVAAGDEADVAGEIEEPAHGRRTVDALTRRAAALGRPPAG